MKNQDFHIDLSTLELGVHEYVYALDDAFFSGLDQEEILGGSCDAKIVLTAKEHSFDLELMVNGQVQAPCDRCLDSVNLPIEVDDELTIKLGQAPDEDDEIVWIDPKMPVLDLDWLLYESIELSLPIVIRHEEGQCNPEMEKILGELSVDLPEEE